MRRVDGWGRRKPGGPLMLLNRVATSILMVDWCAHLPGRTYSYVAALTKTGPVSDWEEVLNVAKLIPRVCK